MEFISKLFDFDNIGQKIKNFTKWACWITILLIWIAAAILVVAALIAKEKHVWVVPIASAVASFVVWVGSWGMYAFGELVQRIINIDRKMCFVVEESTEQAAEEFK